VRITEVIERRRVTAASLFIASFLDAIISAGGGRSTPSLRHHFQ
jgi:hypothetical protein